MVPTPYAESAGPKGKNLYRRFFPNRFLAETYKIVDDPTLDHIISWNKEGSAFIVWSQAEIAKQVLPKYFKHNNFTSFVRQIYSYGFRKIVPLQNVSSDRWEFFNEAFRRGEHLLGNICPKARIVPPVTTASVTAHTAKTYSTGEQVLSPNSSRGVEASLAPPSRFLSANLIEENDKTRKENLMLKEEHGKLKVLCDGMKLLACNYLASQQAGKVASPVVTTMDLMPPVSISDEVKGKTKKVAVARLFGTAIGELEPEEAGSRWKMGGGVL